MRQVVDIRRNSGSFPVGLPPFQGEIVSDPKKPTAEVCARLAFLQVRKERQKYLLDNLFAIVLRQSESGQIPKQRASPLVEQFSDFFLQPRLPGIPAGRGPQQPKIEC
ncbi:MAG TPA: hypothetical protein VN924_18745 [Bryobacteraceae bacterium]|nr:hypothetical protein [Bryobacteraceae bacterium]